MTIETYATEIYNLVDACKPLLAGRDPEVQGAALAELTAMWLDGHHPDSIRLPLLRLHITLVLGLLGEITGDDRAPPPEMVN